MTSSGDRPRDRDTVGGEEKLPQPAQEIVDPRDDEPDPDGPYVEISGAREPAVDPAVGEDAETREH